MIDKGGFIILYRNDDKARIRREDDSAREYKELMDRGGPLKRSNEVQSRDIFSLALALGYLDDISYEIEKEDKFLRATNFGDVLPILINSIAIDKNNNDVDILLEDHPIIFKHSEEYANAGFEILKEKYIKNEEAFIEELRLKILKMNKDNYILEKLSELGI